MTFYKKKQDPLGTTRITGKDLDRTYDADPEGRFEINTAWGIKELFRNENGRWYVSHSGGSRAVFSEDEVQELPEVIYTHSAFLSEEE